MKDILYLRQKRSAKSLILYGTVYLFLVLLALPGAGLTAQFGEGAEIENSHIYSMSADIVFADVNEDKLIDMMTTAPPAAVHWMRGDGEGGFSWDIEAFSVSSVPTAAQLAAPTDMDNDGDLDLVVGHDHKSDYGIYGGVYWVQWYGNLFGNSYEEIYVSDSNEATTGCDVFVGDFSGDGYPDVLFTKEAYNVISGSETIQTTGLFLAVNDGKDHEGEFSNILELYSAETSAGTVMHPAGQDLDGDGDLDPYFTINSALEASSYYVCQNSIVQDAPITGACFITPTALFDFSINPATVQFSDMDLDGDLDIFYAGSGPGGSEACWWANDGAGAFPPLPTATITSTTTSITAAVVGDIDDDCDPDVVLSHFDDLAGIYETIWFENTDGQGGAFTQKEAIASGSQTYALALEDSDNDGDLDLFLSNKTNGTVNQYENLSSDSTAPDYGDFYEVSEENCKGEYVYTADLNGDGAMDIVDVSKSDYIAWCPNDGEGYLARDQYESIYTSIKEGSTNGGNIVLVEPTDLDGDGDLDLPFIVQYINNPLTYGSVHWLENKTAMGNGWEDHTIEQFEAKIQPSNLAVEDMDGDGVQDIVVYCKTNKTVYLYANNNGGSLGSFSTSQEILTLESDPVAFLSSDFDEDGYGDLVSAHNTVDLDFITMEFVAYSDWYVYSRNDEGVLTNTLAFQGESISIAQLEDMNGDGKEDITYVPDTLWGGDLIGIIYFASNGDGTFQDSEILDLGSSVDSVNAFAMADLDEDGEQDLIIGGDNLNGCDALLYFSSKSQCGFDVTPKQLYTDCETTYHAISYISPADFNQDGIMDFALGVTRYVGVVAGTSEEIERTSDHVVQDPDSIGGTGLTFSFAPDSSTLSITQSNGYLPYYYSFEKDYQPGSSGIWIGVAVKIPDNAWDEIISIELDGDEYEGYWITNDGYLVFYFEPDSGDKEGAAELVVNWTPYTPKETITVDTYGMNYVDVKGMIVTHSVGYSTPVSGATVTVQGTEISAQTDENGVYYIEGLSAGSYTLVISKEGFNDNTYSVTVSSTGNAWTSTGVLTVGDTGTGVIGDADQDGEVGLQDALEVLRILNGKTST